MKNIDLKQIKFVGFDFDGVFTDNKVFVDEDGKESVVCSRFDGIGLKRLTELGIKVVIISSEPNPIVKHRARKLNIECFHNVSDKRSVFEGIMTRLRLKNFETLFLGNDINDKEVLKFAGISVGVSDSVDEIEEFIDFKLSRKGGQGAVRELCDLIFFSRINDE